MCLPANSSPTNSFMDSSWVLYVSSHSSPLHTAWATKILSPAARLESKLRHSFPSPVDHVFNPVLPSPRDSLGSEAFLSAALQSRPYIKAFRTFLNLPTVWRNRFLFWTVVTGFTITFPIVYIPVVNRQAFKHSSIT